MNFTEEEKAYVASCVRFKLRRDVKSAARFVDFDRRSVLARRITMARRILRKLLTGETR